MYIWGKIRKYYDKPAEKTKVFFDTSVLLKLCDLKAESAEMDSVFSKNYDKLLKKLFESEGLKMQ